MEPGAKINVDVQDVDNLSLSLEIIDSEDWDDTCTLASSFCSISRDAIRDDQHTSEPQPQPEPEPPASGSACSRIPTPPPLPKYLPVEPYRQPSTIAEPKPIYPSPLSLERQNIYQKWTLYDSERADLNLAKLIRKHLLTREASRKFHEPPNAGPGYFLNQALKKQIEDVREKLDRTEEILALMRKACDLDIEGVITCLDNGVRPFTSGPGLAKLSISPLTLSRDGGFAWQPTASWAWHPWGHMDRPHATAELLRLLVAEGMDVDFPRLFGVTPLCAAVEADRVDILEWLVKRGANVNAEGAVQKSLPGGRVGYHLTALDYAVALGKRASMRYLLGLPVVAVSHTFCITQSGTIPEVDFASGRVDISDKRVVSGVTALHFADTYAAPRLLKGRTSLMHARDSHGRAPFHWAVEEGDVSRTQFLLNEGYPVDCPDGQGATGLALICAAHERGLKRTGYPEIVRLLLMRGADVEMRYPKELSIRSRFWMMQDWRGVYEGIFDEFGLLRKCLEEELERVVRWSGLERAEEGRMVM